MCSATIQSTCVALLTVLCRGLAVVFVDRALGVTQEYHEY